MVWGRILCQPTESNKWLQEWGYQRWDLKFLCLEPMAHILFFVHLSSPLVSTSWWVGCFSCWRQISSKKPRDNDILSIIIPLPNKGHLPFQLWQKKTLGRISIGFDFTLHPVFEAGKKSGTVFGRPVMTPKSLAKRKRGDPTRREGMWRYAMKQNVRCHSQL